MLFVDHHLIVQVITNEEAERRGRMYDANGMTYLLDLDFVHDSEFLFTVDAGIYGNESHFVNHSVSSLSYMCLTCSRVYRHSVGETEAVMTLIIEHSF